MKSDSLTKFLYQFHSDKFHILARHEMHHHCLISKGNRDRNDLENIFPALLSIADKDRLEYGKVSRRPSDLFKMNKLFLSVDPDLSSLAVKDMRPDQH